MHVGLQNSFDAAAAAIKKAVKDIDERERLKKEHEKAAKSKKTEGGKTDEKKPTEEESLPSLFTTPSAAPSAVSANDTPK